MSCDLRDAVTGILDLQHFFSSTSARTTAEDAPDIRQSFAGAARSESGVFSDAAGLEGARSGNSMGQATAPDHTSCAQLVHADENAGPGSENIMWPWEEERGIDGAVLAGVGSGEGGSGGKRAGRARPPHAVFVPNTTTEEMAVLLGEDRAAASALAQEKADCAHAMTMHGTAVFNAGEP